VWICGACVCLLGADFITVFFCTLFLRVTRWPWWWGLDLVTWLCEACNNAHVCLAIFIPRSLHQHGACRDDFVTTMRPAADVWLYFFLARDTQSYSVNIGYVMWQERSQRIIITVFDSWEACSSSEGWLPVQTRVFLSLVRVRKGLFLATVHSKRMRSQEFHALGHYVCDFHVCVAKFWLLPANATFHLPSPHNHCSKKDKILTIWQPPKGENDD